MSAWGASFGDAWGEAWGALTPTPIIDIDLHDGFRRGKKKIEEREKLRQQIGEAIEPAPILAVPVEAAVQILPSRTEYMAIAESEEDDELAIVMALS